MAHHRRMRMHHAAHYPLLQQVVRCREQILRQIVDVITAINSCGLEQGEIWILGKFQGEIWVLIFGKLQVEDYWKIPGKNMGLNFWVFGYGVNRHIGMY